MKGILMKDLMMMRKTIWIYAIMIVCFAGMNGDTGALFSMFYGVMLPTSMIAVDERSHFERLMPMLPVKRIYFVLDKYIAAWSCMFLSLIVGTVSNGIRSGAFGMSPTFLPGMALCLVSQAITMPLILHFGVEKGRMIYMISILGQAVLLGALGKLIEDQILIPAALLSLVVFVLAAAINLGSVFLSKRVYMKRLTA